MKIVSGTRAEEFEVASKEDFKPVVKDFIEKWPVKNSPAELYIDSLLRAKCFRREGKERDVLLFNGNGSVQDTFELPDARRRTLHIFKMITERIQYYYSGYNYFNHISVHRNEEDAAAAAVCSPDHSYFDYVYSPDLSKLIKVEI